MRQPVKPLIAKGGKQHGSQTKRFTKEFKLQVITEVEAGKPMSQVAREHQVNATTIAKWRKQLRQYKDKAFAGNGRSYTVKRARLNSNAWSAG